MAESEPGHDRVRSWGTGYEYGTCINAAHDLGLRLLGRQQLAGDHALTVEVVLVSRAWRRPVACVVRGPSFWSAVSASRMSSGCSGSSVVAGLPAESRPVGRSRGFVLIGDEYPTTALPERVRSGFSSPPSSGLGPGRSVVEAPRSAVAQRSPSPCTSRSVTQSVARVSRAA